MKSRDQFEKEKKIEMEKQRKGKVDLDKKEEQVKNK
jgi:hypothetical protein